MLDILDWIVSIATLDARRMSPVTLFFSILVFGSLGLVLTIVPLAKLMQGSSGPEKISLLLPVGLGAGMLARLSYGVFCRWHGAGSESTHETER